MSRHACESGLTEAVVRVPCRIVGKDTQRNRVGNTLGADFVKAMQESFTQEYQTFHLLCQFSNPVPAAALRALENATLADPGPSLAISAAAQAKYGRLVTDPFNAYHQYDAVDITVTALGGSDLAAMLPTSWLPMGKDTPAFESAMRQRGFLVMLLARRRCCCTCE